MSARRAPAATVDALGLLCPLPLLRLEQAIGRLDDGAEIELLADDPEIERDLPAWCDGNGHELLGLERIAGAVAEDAAATGGDRRPSWRGLVRVVRAAS